ncbi:MAG: hypothetical protein V2I56_08470 [Desulfobacteraceae bacterium]|jgi:hypothetical protein|nr:hypothetical protein [Desulfobacteraceae bacterium]
MKNFIILSFAAVLIIACTHGKTEQFPTVENQSEAAEVFVIRDNNFMGWGMSLRVALDDSIIARLRSGEYVIFYVTPGFHSLGVSKPTITVPFEKGQTYHFLISAEYTKFGFDLRRIGDREAEMWLSKTKPIE